MENETIVKVWERNGKLYGSTDPKLPYRIYNLQYNDTSILTYDLSNVIEGRELVQQYIHTGEKDEG
jgi:hypothetical protein